MKGELRQDRRLKNVESVEVPGRLSRLVFCSAFALLGHAKGMEYLISPYVESVVEDKSEPNEDEIVQLLEKVKFSARHLEYRLRFGEDLDEISAQVVELIRAGRIQEIDISIFDAIWENLVEQKPLSADELAQAVERRQGMLDKLQPLAQDPEQRDFILNSLLAEQGKYQSGEASSTRLLAGFPANCVGRARFLTGMVEDLLPNLAQDGLLHIQQFSSWTDRFGAVHPGHERLVIDEGENWLVVEGKRVHPERKDPDILTLEAHVSLIGGAAVAAGLVDWKDVLGEEEYAKIMQSAGAGNLSNGVDSTALLASLPSKARYFGGANIDITEDETDIPKTRGVELSLEEKRYHLQDMSRISDAELAIWEESEKQYWGEIEKAKESIDQIGAEHGGYKSYTENGKLYIQLDVCTMTREDWRRLEDAAQILFSNRNMYTERSAVFCIINHRDIAAKDVEFFANLTYLALYTDIAAYSAREKEKILQSPFIQKYGGKFFVNHPEDMPHTDQRHSILAKQPLSTADLNRLIHIAPKSQITARIRGPLSFNGFNGKMIDGSLAVSSIAPGDHSATSVYSLFVDRLSAPAALDVYRLHIVDGIVPTNALRLRCSGFLRRLVYAERFETDALSFFDPKSDSSIPNFLFINAATGAKSFASFDRSSLNIERAEDLLIYLPKQFYIDPNAWENVSAQRFTILVPKEVVEDPVRMQLLYDGFAQARHIEHAQIVVHEGKGMDLRIYNFATYTQDQAGILQPVPFNEKNTLDPYQILVAFF